MKRNINDYLGIFDIYLYQHLPQKQYDAAFILQSNDSSFISLENNQKYELREIKDKELNNLKRDINRNREPHLDIGKMVLILYKN